VLELLPPRILKYSSCLEDNERAQSTPILLLAVAR